MSRYSGFTFITGLSFPSPSFFLVLLVLTPDLLCSSTSSSSSGSGDKLSMLEEEELDMMADTLACACKYTWATLSWAGVKDTPAALRASQVPRQELLQK